MKKVLSVIFVLCLLMNIGTPVFAAVVDEIEPLAAVGQPTIGSISIASGTLHAGDEEVVRVHIRFTPTPAIEAWDCTLKLTLTGTAQALEINEYVLVTGNMTVDIPVVFDAAGTGTLNVELRDSQDNLLDNRSLPVTINGSWRILVMLPQDRRYEGMLYLYDRDGDLIYSNWCLGCSVYYDRSPLEYNGNTPTGTYSANLIQDSNIATYGPNKQVVMFGVSGQIVESGRTGICIHGDGDHDANEIGYDLERTKGCIRLLNGHQANLVAAIQWLVNNGHSAVGRVHVDEYPPST